MKTFKKVVSRKKELLIRKTEYYEVFSCEGKYILKFTDGNIFKREFDILQILRNDNIMKIINGEKDGHRIITYPFFEYEWSDYLLYNEYICIRLAKILHSLHTEYQILFSNVGFENIFFKENGFLLLGNFMFYKKSSGNFFRDEEDFGQFTQELLKKKYLISELYDKSNLYIELEEKIERFHILDLQEKFYFLNKIDFQKINFYMKNYFAKIFINELCEIKKENKKLIRDKGQIERAIVEENLNQNYDYHAVISYIFLQMDLKNLDMYFSKLISLSNITYREIFIKEYAYFINGEVNFNNKDNFKEILKNLKEKNKVTRHTAYLFLNNIFYLLSEKNIKETLTLLYSGINSERENVFLIVNNNYISIINGRAVREFYKIIIVLLTDKKYYYHILMVIKEIYQFIPPHYIANDIVPIISRSLVYFNEEIIFSVLNKLSDYLKTHSRDISIQDFKTWNTMISK